MASTSDGTRHGDQSATGKNDPAALKIVPITLDRESWENIPSVVYKSSFTIHSNFMSLKGWASKKDEQLKLASEQQTALENQVEANLGNLNNVRKQLQELSEEVHAMAEGQRQQSAALMVCVGRALRSNSCLQGHLGQTFEVEGLRPEVASASIPNLGEAQSSSKEAGAYAQPTSEKEVGESAALSSRPWLAPGIENLVELSSQIEGQLRQVEDAFDKWRSFRSDAELRRDNAEKAIKDLQVESKGTQLKLQESMQMSKWNERNIDAVKTSLSSTQENLQNVISVQVQRHDVEAVVRESSQQMEDLHARTEARVDESMGVIETHMTSVDKLFKDFQSQIDGQIADQSSQMTQLFERNLNPVNAYLNTMHVKADASKSELDKLNERVPRLAGSLDQMRSELQALEQTSESRVNDLSTRLEQLVTVVAEGGRDSEGERRAMAQDLEQWSQNLSQELEEVRAAVRSSAESLEAMKQGELPSLRRDHSVLQHKVAKWVHANPLPAKLSEARLYSLEARLAEECNARMQLESAVKDYSARAPLALPALPELSLQQQQLQQQPIGSAFDPRGQQVFTAPDASGKTPRGHRNKWVDGRSVAATPRTRDLRTVTQ